MPVIVVGNLTVGGVGKTPLVIAIAERFRDQGVRVGIVSRGYQASIQTFPHEVRPDMAAALVGDEPLLIAKKSGCPVVIAPKRVMAVQYLLKKYRSQIIISDDGLQHYAMGRSIEIVVIDGARGFGNGLCLPAGPLREPVKRLNEVDFIVINGLEMTCEQLQKKTYRMNIQPTQLTRLVDGLPMAWEHLKFPVAAMAGIGNPGRFFSTLEKLGIKHNAYSFADHYNFSRNDLNFKERCVVMTEKDAVKCSSFATNSMYYLPVKAQVDDAFWTALFSHQQIANVMLNIG